MSDVMQDFKVVAPGRAMTAAGPNGLRVLFLPKNSRTAYFQSLLGAARADLAWNTHIVCPDFERSVWREAVKDRRAFHSLPEFSERQAWEGNPDQVPQIDALVEDWERKSGVSAARSTLA